LNEEYKRYNNELKNLSDYNLMKRGLLMNNEVFDLGKEWRMLVISSAISESYIQQFAEHKTNELLEKLKELEFITDEPKVHSQLMREIKSKWDNLSEKDRNLIIKYSCEVNKINKIYIIKVFTKDNRYNFTRVNTKYTRTNNLVGYISCDDQHYKRWINNQMLNRTFKKIKISK
jgi:hypothetical protein